MRHLYIVIDLSACMTEKDLKPNRLICSIRVTFNETSNQTFLFERFKLVVRKIHLQFF
jgi:hypothetical protein